MANSKISALPSATTPLAGTEVVPIVQSGATVNVPVSSLTEGRTVSVGALGVNTTTPGTAAEIKGTTGVALRLNQTTSASSTFSQIQFYENVFTTTGASITSLREGATARYSVVIATKDATSLADRFTVNSAGNCTLATGNLVLGTSGKGVDFSAVVHSGSTSKILTDYEQGTFTPTIIGLTTAGTGTYTTQVGTYTKIGNIVTVTIALTWTAHTGTGNIAISNLPFTAATETSREWTSVPEFLNMTMPITTTPFASISSATTNIKIFSMASGTGVTTGLAMDTAATIYTSLTYSTA